MYVYIDNELDSYKVYFYLYTVVETIGWMSTNIPADISAFIIIESDLCYINNML